MNPDIIIGAVIAVTPTSLAVQHALMTARHRKQDKAAADVWSALANDREALLRDTERRALIAEATVTAFADELAKERRGAVILRTALLDAERDVAEIREFLSVVGEAS